MPTTCLNCQHPLTGDFCASGGQRSSTERFTASYFSSREFLANTFNLEKGFFHTCLNLCYRPGHMVREYLGGQRKVYFNFIAFLLIMLGIEALLWSWGHNTPAQMMQQQVNDGLAANGLDMTLSVADIESVLANQKFLFLPAIPVAAIVPWLVFKRTGYNFLEHVITVCFLLAMNTLLGVSLGLVGLIPLELGTYNFIYLIIANVILVFDFVLYWQLSRQAKYTNGGRLWRVLLAGFSVIAIVATTLQFAIGIKAGIRGKMEERQSIEAPVELPGTEVGTAE